MHFFFAEYIHSNYYLWVAIAGIEIYAIDNLFLVKNSSSLISKHKNVFGEHVCFQLTFTSHTCLNECQKFSMYVMRFKRQSVLKNQ